MHSSTNALTESSPPELSQLPVVSDSTQIICASCHHTYYFAGRPPADDMAKALEHMGWEFRGEWVCPKCRDAVPPVSAYDALSPFEKTVLALLARTAINRGAVRTEPHDFHADELARAIIESYAKEQDPC